MAKWNLGRLIYLIIIILLILFYSPSVLLGDDFDDFQSINHNLFDRHGNIMFLIDSITGDIRAANPAAIEFYGYSQEELLAMTIQDINTFNEEKVREEMGLAEKEQRNHFEFVHQLANGQHKNVEVFSYPVEVAGKNLLFSIIIDVTERVQAEKQLRNRTYAFGGIITLVLFGQFIGINILKKTKEKLISNKAELEHKSFYDSLTNIYNRRFFEEEIQRLDTKSQLPFSIIMADFNGLKIINDSYGHNKGDELLKKTARILKEVLREEDIVARQGGDEFVVLLPDTTQEQLNEIVNRIKDKLAAVNQKEDIPVSISMGTATKEDPDEDINEVLKKADDNMYQNKLSQSNSSKSNIVRGLLNILGAKSAETKEHVTRMVNLTLEFGKKLGLSNSVLNKLSLLATMHDIGKTSISEEILTKPGELNDKEWEVIKKHSEKGYQIASTTTEFAPIAKEILAHHERWDGMGYPRGLKGEEIPCLARIISIIDAYDVMINDRPYSKAISKEEALAEIKDCAGSHFDPELAVKFVEMMEGKSRLT